ncbi:MAG: methyltransferase domain-containing protein, partial [Candidatus Obscuribacterales bacterium]|nr:methyltransferase domain-containing protein [Candidatus Obscuribacterales bacterium]
MTDNSSRQALMKRARVVWANKKLGQNFFVDPHRLEQIAMAIKPGPGDQVVEIGAGLGFLTEVLATTGAKVTAIEFDKVLVDKLSQSFAQSPYDSVSIVHGDFLSFDLALLDAPELK